MSLFEFRHFASLSFSFFSLSTIVNRDLAMRGQAKTKEKFANLRFRQSFPECLFDLPRDLSVFVGGCAHFLVPCSGLGRTG